MRESRTYGSVRGACDETHVPTATDALIGRFRAKRTLEPTWLHGRNFESSLLEVHDRRERAGRVMRSRSVAGFDTVPSSATATSVRSRFRPYAHNMLNRHRRLE
jgi:hypothetical protein